MFWGNVSFVIRTDWLFCWELIFATFRKYPVPIIGNLFGFVKVRAIEIHIFKQYYGMRTLCKTSNLLYNVFFSE